MLHNIGHTLREARERQQKTFEDIHDQTRVSVEHLQLLEKNNFTFLPETYVKSFLKLYAEALELSSDELLTQYEENKVDEQEAASVDGPAATPEKAAASRLRSVSSRQAERGAKVREPGVIEWALAIAAVVVMVAVSIIYVQYRASLVAMPRAYAAPEMRAQPAEYADISVRKPDSELNGQKITPLELEITAKKNIWISLKIDENASSEYTLSPRDNLVWIAEKRFDITIGLVAPKSTGKGRFELAGETISFSLSNADIADEKDEN